MRSRAAVTTRPQHATRGRGTRQHSTPHETLGKHVTQGRHTRVALTSSPIRSVSSRRAPRSVLKPNRLDRQDSSLPKRAHAPPTSRAATSSHHLLLRTLCRKQAACTPLPLVQSRASTPRRPPPFAFAPPSCLRHNTGDHSSNTTQHAIKARHKHTTKDSTRGRQSTSRERRFLFRTEGSHDRLILWLIIAPGETRRVRSCSRSPQRR